MRWIHDLAFRLRALVTPERMRRELDEELRFHLDMEVARLEREGADPAEAERLARAKFGSPARQRDQARWSWGLGWVRDALADGRHVGRQLHRNPGFAIGAILTLALGIGANTAIFSVAERTLLRTPPVHEPDRLAAVYTTCRSGILRCSSSWPDYESYRDEARSLSDIAAYSTMAVNLGDESGTARLATGIAVSGNYFTLLGLQPALGRLIQPSDNVRGGAAQVAVISHDLWRDAFGTAPDVVGRGVRLNGARYEVVGVAPEEFRGLSLTTRADLWVPVYSGPALGPGAGSAGDSDAFDQRGNRWIGTLVGRFAPDASLQGAQAEMDALAIRLGEQFPDARAANEGVRGITVDPVGTYLLPVGNEETLRQFIYILLGVVALTLLLASANLANLFLARATAREQEIGVRMAVGAGRARVIRQLLTESLVLALIGGACGLIVAKLGLGAIGSFSLPGGVSIADLGARLDTRVLAFTFALAAFTALLFGLAPAVQTTRRDLIASAKGAAGNRGSRFGLRKALVAVQVALCLVLLMGSGLFLRTLRNSLGAEIGFEPDSAVAARFNLSLLEYPAERADLFIDDLLANIRALPDVRAASVGTLVPFQNGGFRGTFAEIAGYAPAPDEQIRVDWVVVESQYFAALGARLEGREFDTGDREGSPLVAVINREMADRYWAGRNPVGAQFTMFGGTRLEVVGVVENPTWRTVGEDATPFVFVPHEQFHTASTSFMTLVVRTASPEAALGRVRDQFRALDPGLSLTSLRTMDEQVGLALMPQRMGSVLLSLLGALALILAAVGVFAVVAYTVKRSSRDIGVRIAIGATGADIRRAVLAGMLAPVGIGLAFGGLAAFALSRSVSSFMFQVSPTDPTTLVGISLLLTGVAIVATLLPARAAARLDPVRVLKAD